MINGTFLIGLAALVAGIYLLHGLGWALMAGGGLLVSVSLLAVLLTLRRPPNVNRPI
ncbi:hypothetical protein PN39_05485 [Vibrio anguillarum]|uniref:hypothetical protein n=1 Tax=Vibrio anguillarum TaxID=55601 RepID=UPI001C051F4C|nr:hypothetical protein [Vibrio anguillarum]MBT2925327.1 hypothetical protein [Vibrio anguillarum]